MYDFLVDLDAYFCEKYADYDKITSLPGYRMPKMQTSEVREDGRTYAYTLPANTMRLAKQEGKAELLAELKTRMLDKTFSFSFSPCNIFTRIKNVFSKYAPHKHLKLMLEKYGVTQAAAGENLNIEPEILQGIWKGKFVPTKNLLFSLALTAHWSFEDTKKMMEICYCAFDYTVVKDVVIAYLLHQKVYNRDMIDAALAEYKVTNLFLK